MRVLRNTNSGPFRLNRRDFLKGCVAFAALGIIPTGLLRKPCVGKKQIRGYRRLRPLTDRDLYGTNPYSG